MSSKYRFIVYNEGMRNHLVREFAALGLMLDAEEIAVIRRRKASTMDVGFDAGYYCAMADILDFIKSKGDNGV